VLLAAVVVHGVHEGQVAVEDLPVDGGRDDVERFVGVRHAGHGTDVVRSSSG
jgi:hypothetical protein